MRAVLVALAAIGGAGVVVGVVAHLRMLRGSTLAWMGPVAPWRTAPAFIGIGLLAVIRWLTRDWVWAHQHGLLVFAYGGIFPNSLYLLTARDETGLDTPGDSVRRA